LSEYIELNMNEHEILLFMMKYYHLHNTFVVL